MYVVYAIHNQDHDKIYIGQTQDIAQRVKLHNSKQFKQCYTADFDGVWKVIYQEEVESRSIALKREKQLKSYRGRQFLRKFVPGPIAQW
jgi:putative endonuclease